MSSITILVGVLSLYVYLLALISARTRPQAGDPADDKLFFVLIVPALNEEQVIANTLTSLLALRGNFLAIVIDDASNDGTVAAITPFLEDPRLRLLQQPPDQARRGKGHVLNTGYAEIQRLGLPEKYGHENVVVVIFDSDGRVEPDFLLDVSPFFRDPKVAGVQSAVRMYNADHSILTLWQHLEFIVWGHIFCRAKNAIGSATLGGNGQCMRFSALTDLGPEPWQAASLTEDLEMSLRLLVQGWQLRFCPTVAVWQEAVPRFRALLRQRSRWLQGQVVCWRYIPPLLRSALPVRIKIDLVFFLLMPLAFLPIGISSVVSWFQFLGNIGNWTLPGLLIWYVVGFQMVPLVLYSWRKNQPPAALWRLLLHSHLFGFYSAAWFLGSIIVYWQILRGQRAWAKTSRVVTGSTAQPAVVPNVAAGRITISTTVQS